MARVLVIDAAEAIRDALRLVLEGEGYAVTTTSCPDDAMDLLRASAARMVVLFDAGIPRVSDGRVVALASLDDPLVRRHTYICMTTSEALLPADLHAALVALAVPIIQKPFDIEVVLVAVKVAADRILAGSGQTRQ
jgi:CheY-like chemotaxis protein